MVVPRSSSPRAPGRRRPARCPPRRDRGGRPPSFGDDGDPGRDPGHLVQVVAGHQHPAPSAARRSRASRSRMIPAGSRALVGSSRMIRSGRCCRAAARPSRCLLPDDIRRARMPAYRRRSSSSSTASTIGPICRVGTPRSRAATPGWSARRVRRRPAGTRECAHPGPGVRPAERTSAPSNVSSPALGRSIPSISFIRVDLPAPFSPTSAWISAGRHVQIDAPDPGTPAVLAGHAGQPHPLRRLSGCG